MVEKDAHEKWVQGFSRHFRDGHLPVHRHVADRLAVLLELAEVKWVDGEVKGDIDGVSGSLHVFTDVLVASVTLKDELPPGRYAFASPQGSTGIAVFPRSGLAQVRLPAGGPSERRHAPFVWARWAPDQQSNNEGWPDYDAPVELDYAGHIVTVGESIGAGREGFDEFMASIMRDLAGAPRNRRSDPSRTWA